MVKTTIREASGSLPSGGKDGKYRIRIIGSDVQGSSGYYPRETIERDGPSAWPAGTKIYADHPSMAEVDDRPERSVRNIAGFLLNDAVMEEDGLYADVQFGRDYRTLVEDFHSVIGMSIYAGGEMEESEDESGNIVRKVTSIYPSPTNSVDLVTVAGAQGAITEALTESFREIAENKSGVTAADKESERIVPMDDKDIKAIVDGLTEALAPTIAAVDSLVESLKPEAGAGDEGEPDLAAVTESAVEAGLPKMARSKVVEAVKAGADVEKAIEAEKGYMESILAEVKVETHEQVETGHVREAGAGSLEDKFNSLAIFGGKK